MHRPGLGPVAGLPVAWQALRGMWPILAMLPVHLQQQVRDCREQGENVFGRQHAVLGQLHACEMSRLCSIITRQAG